MSSPQQTDLDAQLDWAQLIELEPRLLSVEAEALAAHAPGLPNWAAWEAIKRQFRPLVGSWRSIATTPP